MAQETHTDGPLSVAEAIELANRQLKALPSLVVRGEVSGFRGPNARSGHCYFDVKDDSAAMSVIVWRGTAQRLDFALKDGLEVVLTGGFDVYRGSGKMSFVARKVELAGEGLLRQQVAELARRLEAEGLMEASRKRKVPVFCTRVCVVTSLSGSVIEDVKRTLRRRNPLVKVDVVGCAVQGRQAPATIVRALRVAEASRPEAILLVRGGGSFEDLMCFNDESVARAIAACTVPVVTGIGHEPDTTIADMVADRRASTPTAAAESVAPPFDQIESQMVQRQLRLGRAMQATLERCATSVGHAGQRADAAVRARLDLERSRVEAFASRPCLRDPRATLVDQAHDLDRAAERLAEAMPRALARRREGAGRLQERLVRAGAGVTSAARAQLARQAASLDALSPLRVLARGYAIAERPDGHVLRSAAEAAPGDRVRVRLGEGSLEATVERAVLPEVAEGATGPTDAAAGPVGVVP